MCIAVIMVVKRYCTRRSDKKDHEDKSQSFRHGNTAVSSVVSYHLGI